MDEETNGWTDRLGAVASSVCALHCAVCALLPALFASMGIGFLLSHEVEWVLTIAAILFGCVALSMAWRTHRSAQAAFFLLLGTVGLLASRGIEMTLVHDDFESVSVEQANDPHSNSAVHRTWTSSVEDSRPHHSDEAGSHLVGAGVGVGSGLLLVLGHLLNIRAARRCREQCFD